ncbi:amino acid ABC transporter substrate-binding protein [Desulfoluna spongiiphila]|uniref:Amino acid ABC transporter substrate-binding protein, PAAT family n=1 Tax=Desulfoluna spongiiphila TaxID=419481 RepID=A0A1G5E6A4_9BACT|nr:amino acid ABC transporter substrate-binding protein [Desulfoluna spongiiphila]SCY22499.1 amino acid ABC transporter substrate-binding protein, PAAT family [Desulfoluna spongiiphila]VVS91616.1 solute-binding protein family 3/n-terminal domain of mltf [Desulfoluna spongiiphila]
MKRAVVFLICLFAMTTMAFAGDGSFDRVKKEGKLVLGLDDSFPPMGYKVADGTIVGFDIDAAKEVCKRLDIELALQPTAWKGVINSLYAKKFDCIWNGMTITKERVARVNFTKPYILDGQVVVVRFTEKRFADYKDLGGMIVGCQEGSPAVTAAKKLPNAPKAINEYEDNPKALLDLKAGRLDAVVIDNVTGRDAIAKQVGSFKTLPGFISKEPFGVAFRKEDNELRGAVQKALDEMVADGTMAKISEKWFGEDITDPTKW